MKEKIKTKNYVDEELKSESDTDTDTAVSVSVMIMTNKFRKK